MQENEDYYEKYHFPSFLNQRVGVKDLGKDVNEISLGVWHILPENQAYKALHDSKFDYEKAFKNDSYDVLIYFHGTGETRADDGRTYQLLTRFFHVIAFDYRGK